MKQHIEQKYEVEQVEKPNIIKNFDYILLALVLALSIIGIIVLHSAVASWEPNEMKSAVVVQIVGLVLGFIIAVVLGVVDYHIYKQFAIFFYIFNIVLMLLVYSPIGMDINNSRSWLDFKVITYQPSELMKIATIMMVAVCLEDFNNSEHRVRDVFRALFFFAIPFGLVVLQKDFGTALVFLFIFVVMLFVAGIKLRYFVLAGLSGIVAFPFIWKFALNDTRRKRILSFIDPSADPLGSSYQAHKARLAIGSGQITGKGIGEGPLNNGGNIPVKESDFIFSVIGEELGFIGASLVVILFFLVLARLLYNARKASEPFGNYVTMGVFAMFAFHFIQNIGMNVGLLPITGIPLPFISKGGSAMITNYFSIGIVLSIAARRTTGHFFD